MTETFLPPGRATDRDGLLPAAPVPERLDPATITPGHPAWAAEAAELLRLGFPDPEAREAARERLIRRALAEGWSLRRLGHAILTERAEASEATRIDPRHVVDQRAPGAEPDPNAVWGRVARAPRPGEVTNATRGTF